MSAIAPLLTLTIY